MGSAFNLGKIFGIQFRLHYTWFVIFILITVTLSWQYLPSVYPAWSELTYWLAGIFTSLVFFASVVAHELAHSLVGRANDIPVKSITLFIFGGVAQMTREAPRHGAELKMAAAGPVCSLVIGGLFFGVYFLVRGISEPIAAMAVWLAQVNVVLAVFNMIPGFPLDGGRVFRSLLWRFSGNYRRSTRIATIVGQGIGYLFILGGLFLIFIYPQQWFNGLWLAVVGWFLGNTASASYRQARWQETLQKITAVEIMTSDCPLVPSNVTVDRLAQDYILARGYQCFMVVDDGELKGVLTLRDIKSVAKSKWEITRLIEVMTPLERLKIVSSDQEALGILEQMDESNISQMPVVRDGKIIGMVTRDNLTRFLRARS